MTPRPLEATVDHLDDYLPGRFVDPKNLVCPGCKEQVRPEPPGYWVVKEGLPAPGFSHQDATALCRTPAGRVAEPIEFERV